MFRGLSFLAFIFAAILPLAASAQVPSLALVVTSCGSVPSAYIVGTQRPLTIDVNGNFCGTMSGGGSTITTPGQRVIVPLDVSTVTTGGTPVTALAVGHKTAGGFVYNPIGATINLCVSEQGTASGTVSSGATTCLQPGQAYILTPSAGAVSVVTSDSAHAFSGQGYQ